MLSPTGGDWWSLSVLGDGVVVVVVFLLKVMRLGRPESVKLCVSSRLTFGCASECWSWGACSATHDLGNSSSDFVALLSPSFFKWGPSFVSNPSGLLTGQHFLVKVVPNC